MIRGAAECAGVEPRLGAEWTLRVRSLSRSLGWETAVLGGDFLRHVRLHQPGYLATMLRVLPEALARTPSDRRVELVEALKGLVVHSPEHLESAAVHLPNHMERLAEGDMEGWLAALKLARQSVETGDALLAGESVEGRLSLESAMAGVSFFEVAPYLQHYANAHCGRFIRLEATDGLSGVFDYGGNPHVITLPARLREFGDERDALSFRIVAALAIGAVEFGRYDYEGEGSLDESSITELDDFFAAQKMPWLARSLFEELERYRIRSWITLRYPGLARDLSEWTDALLQVVGGRPKADNAVDQVLEDLRGAWLGRTQVQGLGQELFEEAKVRLSGGVNVEETVVLVKEYLPKLLDKLPEASGEGHQFRVNPSALPPMTEAEQEREERLRGVRGLMREEGLESRLEVIRTAIEARGQQRGDSFAEVMEFLERNPPPDGGLVDPSGSETSAQAQATAGVGQELLPEGGVLYAEWGEDIADYRPNWVRVREFPIEGGDATFFNRVRAEHGAHIDSLRRSFESLRPEHFRKIPREAHGDDLDIEAVIGAQVERRMGGALPDRLYTRRHRRERNVAVALLIDLSSSTNEPARFGGKRIIDVEKEALVIAAEALDALGDRFALYGYSGFSREEVAFFVAKKFSDPLNDRVRAQVGGLSFKMENRDGAAIRHAGQKLLLQPAHSRVLMLLSDGKPLDCGGPKYKEAYAQEDTRMALTELRQQGIRSFCITVDPRGGEYLADVYGEGNYIVVDDVARLPQLLPRFYRRVAT